MLTFIKFFYNLVVKEYDKKNINWVSDFEYLYF